MIKRTQLVAVVIGAVLSLGALASNTVNQEMSHVASMMHEILPYIDRDTETFTDKDIKKIRTNIAKVKIHINKAVEHQSYKPETFALSYKTIIDHLDTIDTELADKNTRYAKSLLRSTTTLCSACHTQDTKAHRMIKSSTVDYGNMLQNADFYYMTRDYEKALGLYSGYLKSKESLNWDIDTITSLERPLVIHLQIRNDLNGAIRYVEDILSHKGLQKGVRKDISEWLQGLEIIKKETKKSALKGMQEIDFYMYKYIVDKKNPDRYQLLKEDERVMGLWIRGRLHAYFSSPEANKEIPKALLWLSIVDRALAYDIDYSLADLYLKQCIKAYPQSAYARQCFNLYKDYIEFSYSGSAGVNVPEERRDELYELEQLLKKS